MNTRSKIKLVCVSCLAGVSLVLACCGPCSAENNDTCPDYPQHDAVLNKGLDALQNAPRGRHFGQPDISPATMELWAGARFRPLSIKPRSLDDVLCDELKAIQNDVAFSPVSTLDTSARNRVDQAISSVRMAVLAAAGKGDAIFLGDSLRFNSPKVLASSAANSILGFMRNSSTINPARKDIIKDARMAMERLSGCAGSTFSEDDLLILAGLRDLTDDHKAAVLIYETLLPIREGANKYSDRQLITLEHVLASFAMASDWSKVLQFEAVATKTSDAQVARAILETYVAYERVADTMRMFRSDQSSLCYSTTATRLIIRNAAADDRPKLAQKLDYARRLSEPIFTELVAKKWNKEALCMCLGSATASASDNPRETVRRLARDFEQSEVIPRVMCAARVSIATNFDQFASQLLSELVERLISSDYISAVSQGKRDLAKVAELRSAIRSIGGPQTDESLEQLNRKEEPIRKRVEILECLQLAFKLHETGDELLRRGAMTEARDQYTSALDIRRKNLDASDPLIATTLLDLALTDALLKRDGEAEREFQESIELLKKHGNSAPRLKEALENYGCLLSKVGKSREADLIYEESKHLNTD